MEQRSSNEAGSCLLALLVLGLLPMPCLLPRLLFRLSYGRGPHDADTALVQEGMSKAKVIALIGPPHNVRPEEDGSESWTYFTDSLGWNYDGVRFGPDGKVAHWWVY